MKILNVMIVDDEIDACRNLQKTLLEYIGDADVNIVSMAQNTRLAEALINEHKPDVVFLDIEIEEAMVVKGTAWFALAKWAKENNQLTPFDRKLAYNLGVLHSRRVQLSPKQAKNALRILKEAKNNGCIIEE